MATNRDEVLNAALALNADDRAIVANRLLDSLTESGDVARLDPEWAREIERRIAAFDRGESQAIGIDDVKRILRERRIA